MNGAPSSAIEFRASVPVWHAVDVLVVGGGPAGIAAAIAAARSGARTGLAERYGFLGGTATAGLVGPFMGVFEGNAERVQLIRGLFDEIVRRMEDLGGAIHPSKVIRGEGHSGFRLSGHNGVTPFEPETLKLVAAEMCLEAGVRLSLHSRFIAPILEGDRIGGVILATKAGLQAIRASVVVDCSGDGDVAMAAGVPMVKGRESDGLGQGVTLFFRVKNVDTERVERYAKEHPQDGVAGKPFGSLVAEAKAAGDFTLPRDRINFYRTPDPGVWGVNASRIVRIDPTSADELTRAEIEGRRQVVELLRFLRKYVPGCEQAQLAVTATQIGVRESRRIVGEHTLTLEDLQAGRHFADAVVFYNYPVDIHSPTDGTGGILNEIPIAPVYQIPYRSLVPLRVEQLLVAGRCLSATHEAAAAARVMPACFAMGQAAGTAAALALAAGTTVRRLDPESLRRRLREQGAYLGEGTAATA
jgi:2-polyprenyl-6-methoxyphenol hydroxylase-like FAD-dependent oxidoreductase